MIKQQKRVRTGLNSNNAVVAVDGNQGRKTANNRVSRNQEEGKKKRTEKEKKRSRESTRNKVNKQNRCMS